MPTEKPRITITMTNDQLAKVKEFEISHNCKNQTKAILALMEIGLSKAEKSLVGYSSLSTDDADVAKRYHGLDAHGKKAVKAILAVEQSRMKTPKEAVPAKPMKVIPLIGNSFAAGLGDPDFGNPWEDYEVPEDSKADFAIKINGDSMEPWLPDGSVAYGVKRRPMDGEVAALLLDGDFICKQVCQDAYGNLYLFALNRSRKDADQEIMHDAERSLTCFGTILMDRVPLPADI